MERIEPADWPRAIARAEGPQMVVSGPGGGKTEFLVRRAVHLIEYHGVAPDSLLLLSFSRRSARDLRQRIEDRISGSFTEVPSSTFHALALRVLERHGSRLHGWRGMPTLLTAPEYVAVVRRLLASEDENRWPAAYRPMLRSATFAEDVAEFLQRCRELLIDRAELSGRIADRPQWRGLDAFLERYDRDITESGRIDYGTLQAKAVEVMGNPEVASELGSRHPYILVDEFQDTTKVQARLLHQLYSEHRNLTVTGDPYQSIYGFRGADPSNLTDFVTSFPDGDGRPAAHLVLTTSFRVRAEVLRAAERITAGGALPEVAGPVEPAPGPSTVEAVRFTQQSEEAEWIAGEVERIHLTEGIPFSTMAVLVRTKRRILSELSRALERRRIPHDRPDVRSVDQPAVRIVADVVIAAVGDAVTRAPALQRLLLGPLYRLTLGRWREFQRTAARAGTGWSQLLRAEIPEAAGLADLIEDPSWATEGSAADGFWHLWSHLDRFDAAVASADDVHRRALSSLSQVLERLAERDRSMTLARYVEMLEQEDFEAVPLLGYLSPDEDRLALTTMHQAKGLEFDVVFIADAVEGVLPDLRRHDSYLDTRLLDRRQPEQPEEYALARLREEMRLAYTAMCRASRRVVWTATAAGIGEDQRPPSRFVAAAMGAATVEEAMDPPPDAGAPVTTPARVAAARRTVRDVTASDLDRLAALGALVRAGHLPPLAHGALAPGSDGGIVPDGMMLSPSQAESFDRCPRRYVLERRLKLGEAETLHMVFGSLIHDVLEATESAAIADDAAHGTAREALAHLDRLFDPADFGGEPWATAWHRRAVECLERLYGRWPEDSLPVREVEKPLEMDLGGARWVGRADRVEADDGDIHIVDYKTSRSPMTRAEAERSLQLAFYALAIEADATGRVTAAELWYPAARRTAVPVLGLDLGRLDELRDRLEEVAAAIRAEDWTPTPGDHCERCRMRQLCPAWPEGAEAFA